MENKRGQGMSTNTIILLILGIVILVVLIVGFTVGFGKIAPFLSGSNVDNIVTACTAACATGGTFDFCETLRELNDGTNDKFEETCNTLSGDAYADRNYGVAACPTITCAN